MCEESAIIDPQIIELCGAIVETQVREIDEMKESLAEADSLARPSLEVADHVL